MLTARDASGVKRVCRVLGHRDGLRMTLVDIC